jgi:hypothetical protein
VVLDERGLERVEVIWVGSEILHGPHGRAVGLDGENRARLHGATVEVHRAGAAVRGVAADLGAGEVEVLPQEVDEQSARLDLELDRPTVDDEPNRNGWGRRSGDGIAQAGTPTAATSSSALPMPSTI